MQKLKLYVFRYYANFNNFAAYKKNEGIRVRYPLYLLLLYRKYLYKFRFLYEILLRNEIEIKIYILQHRVIFTLKLFLLNISQIR